MQVKPDCEQKLIELIKKFNKQDIDDLLMIAHERCTSDSLSCIMTTRIKRLLKIEVYTSCENIAKFVLNKLDNELDDVMLKEDK